jgi:DNA repair exonuclease SbcCD nuclease subunit
MAENTVENDHEQQSDIVAKRRDGIVTVVFTADNHLGYTAFGQQPRKREERQQRLRHAFQQACDFAIMQGVDLFIQAGDLFDTTTPDERDRSFVASRLAQLKQAGVRTFALGGAHDTPSETLSLLGESTPAPQLSFARLGALHYFPPVPQNERKELEPVLIELGDVRVGICALGVLADQEGDPLADLRVQDDIERTHIPLLVLHAPIEGLSSGSSLLDLHAQVSHKSIEKQTVFRYILAGYHHGHSRMRIGQTDIVVAGATQRIDFAAPDHAPGFIFLGLAADGIRWCNHISVDSLDLQRLVIKTHELWSSASDQAPGHPTDFILERLRPLCSADTMVQLRLEGELTRSQYHQLDLNQIRRYGEEHCFALAIDDSALSLLPEQETVSVDTGERFSLREELISLVDEWVVANADEQEKRALHLTRDELLLAMDEMKGKR